METVLELTNKTYDDIVRYLNTVSNKGAIKTLKIDKSLIFQLKIEIFNGINNLVDLNLSNCSIYNFEHEVFDSLTHLESINLSNNIISSIDNGLFEKNTQLQTIILQNNILDEINNGAFSVSKRLEKLNLSYNFITVLDTECLISSNLKELSLSHNRINNVLATAFSRLPNLRYLDLDHNVICDLDVNVFSVMSDLQYLNLSNNAIGALSYGIFWNLKELQSLYMKNNVLLQKIDQLLFCNQSKLLELDLSDNNIVEIQGNAFDSCPNLTILRLKTSKTFKINSLKYLLSLRKFELFYQSKVAFYLLKNAWNYVRYKTQLTVIKFVFLKLEKIQWCNLKCLINLEYLHIECLEPNNRISSSIPFRDCFYLCRKINTIIFKTINTYAVTNLIMFLNNHLEHLTLAGVKTNDFKYVFRSFVRLTFLDLSFSNIDDIKEFVFDYLVNLQHLYLNHTKITSITQKSFFRNRKLRYLNCSNSLIENIEDFSFRNLQHLRILDLSSISRRNFPDNVFYGLRRPSCFIIL